MDNLEEPINIKSVDLEKAKFYKMLKAFNLFYRDKKAKSISDNLRNAGDPVIRFLHELALEVSKKMSDAVRGDPRRYEKMIRKPMEFFLNIPYSDSAYKDPFYYMLYRIGKKIREDDSFWELIKSRYKTPDLWYYNIWQDYQRETNEKQEKGELDKDLLSPREHLMVDETGEQEVRNFVKKQLQNKQKHQHW